MKLGRYVVLSTFVIFFLMASCTAPTLKRPRGDAVVAEPAAGCSKCHTPGEVETGDASTMHSIHFAALAQETRCAMCHPAETQGKTQASHMAGGKTTYVTSETAARVEPYYLSWATSAFLDNKHNENQVDCAGCHGIALPLKNPPMEQCFKCHGSYAELARLPHNTMHNPHNSHMGEIECTLCHKGHTKFELYCNECHQFDDASESGSNG